MREMHEDYRKGQDDMGARGAPRQVTALEVWFDLKACVRYAKAMTGLPPRPECARIRLVPIRPDVEIERLSPEDYDRQLRYAKKAGTAWFLRQAGRSPHSPKYDQILTNRIIKWVEKEALVDPFGKPFGTMAMPDDLKAFFSQTND